MSKIKKQPKAKKQVVFVCVYNHKYGIDVGVYKDVKSLRVGVISCMNLRVRCDWDADDAAKFRKLRSFDKKMDLFHEVEKRWNYSETLDTFERPVE